MADNKLIHELLMSIKNEQVAQGKELAKQSIILEQNTICLEKVQEDLKYHIKRTDTLERMYQDTKGDIDRKCPMHQEKMEILEKKVEKLEEPSKMRKILTSKIVKASAALGTILSVVLLVLKISNSI